ncbi:MAG: ATP-binding cassette domain-containing protein [Spirochaetes bacterium]|nr:ATP-binding cassette domain-containing protein [Spirochaetota bacterium]
MIVASDLGKFYGSLEAVKGVSFSITQGEIVGLLGPNGAGKTTIMKILTCYMFPSYGDANVNDYNIYSDSLQVKRSIGYMPENAPLYPDLNVMEYLDFMADARGLAGNLRKERIDFAVDACKIGNVIYRGIGKLSKGYRQRTGLAQAILHDPEILILDEPTNGLDPNQIIEIRELIKELGKKKTVILSTHILQEVEATCGRVLILNDGKIIARGTTEEIGRGMKGEVILDLTVKGSDLDEAENSLSSLEGVKKVLSSKKVEDLKKNYHLSLTPDSHAEEEIFDWAVSHGYRIVAMIPERFSLEDIFIKLTSEGGENAN